MEIEVKPISLQSRLEYLTTISEQQRGNTKKFPWLISAISLVIGAGIVFAAYQYQKKQARKSTSDLTPLP